VQTYEELFRLEVNNYNLDQLITTAKKLKNKDSAAE
jgi:hypothetical protein